nr:MAG TPA: hypothetical protein [Caudoviricetes sp.]
MKLRIKNKCPYSHKGFRDFFGEFESLLLRQNVKPSSFNDCWVLLTLPRLFSVPFIFFPFSLFALFLQNLRKNYG